MRYLGFALLALIAACSDERLRRDRSQSPAARVEFAAAAAAGPAAAPAVANGGFTQQASLSSYLAAQKLIRSGELRAQVANVRDALRAADSIGKAHGALLADRRLTQEPDGRQQAELTFRVPSDRFDECIAALRAIGDMQGESVNTQDITRDYADLATRLGVKEQTVARLRSLLDRRTANLADVLAVERELARTVTELEQLKGEQRYYDQQIALSMLKLTLSQPAPTRVYALTGPVRDAFRGSVNVLGLSIAGVVYGFVFIVPWLIVVTLLWILVRRTGVARHLVRLGRLNRETRQESVK